MTADPEGRLNKLREDIETSDRISDRDRDLLCDFDDELALRRSQYATATRYKLLQYCSQMAGHASRIPVEELPDVELHAALSDREAAEDVVRWIHDRYDNAESNAAFRRALRTCGRLAVGEPGGLPDAVAWISTTLDNSYDPSPDPGDMLDWADIKTLTENCLNSRDAALIAVGWDAGCRGSELRSLTIGDVSDHDHGLRIHVDGKMGQRSVTLIPSVPFLQRWLSDHPARDDPDAPLWSALSEARAVSYETLWKALDRAGDRAEIDKPVTITNLRRSSASHLASQGMSQAHLEDHHGWTRGSDAAAHYIAVFGEDADRELAAIHGEDVSESEPEPIGPVECPRCGRDTPRDEPTCMWCDQALSHVGKAELDAAQDETRQDLLRFAKEHPELLGQLEDMEPVIDLVDGDTELIDEARRFLDAVRDDSDHANPSR
jgi:integrase